MEAGMNKTNSELRPCPFCGGKKIAIEHDASMMCPFQSKCSDCGATTLRQTTKEKAIREWNFRWKEDALNEQIRLLKEDGERLTWALERLNINMEEQQIVMAHKALMKQLEEK
jgi:Lar family restriction alleviation protein